MSQPSASRRLAALEGRLGTTLFDRDTTGARATSSGIACARQSSRLLAELDALPEHVLASGRTPSLAVGTIQALGAMVFTALEIALDGVEIVPEVDHGPSLIQMVHRGGLDAAFITIAEQTVIPRGLTRSAVGDSPLVLVLPADAEPPATRGRRPLSGRTVFYNTIDLSGESTRERLASMGATPRAGATAEATLLAARHHGCAALVPEFVARWYSAPGDRMTRSPIPGSISVSLIARPPRPQPLTDALPHIRKRILGADGA